MKLTHVGVVGAGNIGAGVVTDLVLHGINAVAVDLSGNVYTSGHDAAGIARWLQLTPGATRPTELPVAGLRSAADLAVNSAGVLFLIDALILSIYVGKGGGIGPARKIAAVAEAAGLTCTVGSNLELGVASAAMAHLATAIPSLTSVCRVNDGTACSAMAIPSLTGGSRGSPAPRTV